MRGTGRERQPPEARTCLQMGPRAPRETRSWTRKADTERPPSLAGSRDVILVMSLTCFFCKPFFIKCRHLLWKFSNIHTTYKTYQHKKKRNDLRYPAARFYRCQLTAIGTPPLLPESCRAGGAPTSALTELKVLMSKLQG